MDKSKELQIYCYTHKMPGYGLVDDEYHTPLHVGKAEHPGTYVCELTDSTGDNISDRNYCFREVTGMYWLWKNNPDVKYIGTEHYRRRYDANPRDIIDWLDRTNGIIMLQSASIGAGTLFQQYGFGHSFYDINIIREIVAMKYPEYLGNFNDNVLLGCNSWISNLDTFNGICSFVFDIINAFIHEQRLDTKDSIIRHIQRHCEYKNAEYMDDYIQYQLGIFGFISERLVSMYVMHNFKNKIMVPPQVPGLK